MLDKNGRPGSGKRRNASPLLQVAFCRCGKPLYQDSGSRHAYHRCADRGNCKARAIPVDDLHERIDSYLRIAYADSHIPIRVEIPAEDHTTELADVDQAIADLAADRYERGLFKGEKGTRRYTDMMTRLEAKRETLAGLPQHPARIDWKDGGPFLETWDPLDDEGKGRLLRRMGYRITAWREGKRLEVRGHQGSPHPQ